MKEIERKWIVTELPDTGDQTPIQYERYFIFDQECIEVRIQMKGDRYEFERKVETSELTRTGQKFEITKLEFETLKKLSIGEIKRESYMFKNVSIKVYKGRHEGLIRAEVEFESEQKADKFTPLPWFGPEITDSEVGRDKKLMKLDEIGFKQILDNLLNK